jgi:hypothetical protein
MIKTKSLCHLNFEMKITINIVDKFNKKKEDLSPERNIKTSIKINKNEIKENSKKFLLFLITNSANKSGNNLVR